MRSLVARKARIVVRDNASFSLAADKFAADSVEPSLEVFVKSVLPDVAALFSALAEFSDSYGATLLVCRKLDAWSSDFPLDWSCY